MFAARLAQFQVDPSRGPEQAGDFEVEPGLFLALVLIGFLVGIFGHIVKSKTMVAIGITMIFVATVAAPLAITLAN